MQESADQVGWEYRQVKGLFYNSGVEFSHQGKVLPDILRRKWLTRRSQDWCITRPYATQVCTLMVVHKGLPLNSKSRNSSLYRRWAPRGGGVGWSESWSQVWCKPEHAHWWDHCGPIGLNTLIGRWEAFQSISSLLQMQWLAIYQGHGAQIH